MPTYPYLNDDTAFTAPSLNQRFSLVADALNVLGTHAIAQKALNTIHIPSPVDGIVTAGTSGVSVHTPSHEGAPPVVSTAGSTISTPLVITVAGYSAELAAALTLTRSTDNTQPTALLVLANVEIREFRDIEVIRASHSTEDAENETMLYGITLNEYEWDATVVLVCEDSAGTQRTLYRTERQLSPCVTIGWAGNDTAPGHTPRLDPPDAGTGLSDIREGRIAMGPLRDMPGDPEEGRTTEAGSKLGPDYKQFDHKTFQDVAIRTVITADDLVDPLGLSDIKKVHIGFLSVNDRKYKVQRANITLVPLFTEVA